MDAEKFWVNVEQLTPAQHKVFEELRDAWDHFLETGDKSRLIEARVLYDMGDDGLESMATPDPLNQE